MYKQKAKMKKTKILKGSRGITLIALVITIIVLLILAGVSLATLVGENGVIKKATTAREKTNIANVKEMAQTDILGYQVENESEEITIGQLKDVLNKYFKDVPEEGELKEKLKDTNYTLKVKEEYGGDSIEVRVSDIYAAKLEELAKDVLKVNPDATNDYEKSPYIKYNNILCRVFYNDDTHGLQIISANSMPEKVTLGSSDFDEAKEAYNNVVDTLNDEAKKYMNSGDGIAIDARSLGSIATLENGKFQGDTTDYYSFTHSGHKQLSKYDDIFKVADKNYEQDINNIESLGLRASSDTWLASRFIDVTIYSHRFCVRKVYPSGNLDDDPLCGVNSYYGTENGGLSYSYGLRPVFLLSSSVKIKSGDGTKDNPYELEI